MQDGNSSSSSQHFGATAFPDNSNQKRVAVDDLEKADGKWRRTRTGCLSCRRRKVKCDEVRPTCKRCTKGELQCSWPVKGAIASPASSSSVSVSSRAESSRIMQTPSFIYDGDKTRSTEWAARPQRTEGSRRHSGDWQRLSGQPLRPAVSPRSSLLSLPPISTLLREAPDRPPSDAYNGSTDSTVRFDSLFGLPKTAESQALPLNFYQDTHYVNQMADSLQRQYPEGEANPPPPLAPEPATNHALGLGQYGVGGGSSLLLIQERGSLRRNLSCPPPVAAKDAKATSTSSPGGSPATPHPSAEIMHVFSPQPATDPMLRWSSSSVHILGRSVDSISFWCSPPALKEHEVAALQRVDETNGWKIPAALRAAMTGMSSRHVELLIHCRLSVCRS